MQHFESNFELPIRSPQAFFSNALAAFHADEPIEALQYLDTAIVLSHNAPFYIYQKIRFLYECQENILEGQPNCETFILSQLEYLYNHASLYILCRTIDYLERVSHYDTDKLREVLKSCQVPYCLADHYPLLLRKKQKPFLTWAKKAFKQDDYTLCLDYCHLYLKLYPTTSDLCYMQAFSYHMLGQLLEAKPYYERYLSFNPNLAQAHRYLGYLYMDLRQFEKAISYFKKASSLEISPLEDLLLVGECYYLAKKWDLAITTYKAILEKSPSYIQCYFNLAQTYKKALKPRLAKKTLKLAQKEIKKKNLRECRS